MIAWLVAVLGGGAGCAQHYRIVVLGADLRAAGPELRARGQAVVRAKRIKGDHERVWITTARVGMDQTVQDGRKTRWVRDLLRGCSDDLDNPAANTDCELVGTYGDAYQLGTETDYSTKKFLSYTLTSVVAAALIGAVGCTVACDHGSDWYTASTITVGVTGGLLVGALVWAVVGCFGRWGSPGCRD